MAVDTYALLSVDAYRSLIGLAASDTSVNALRIYHDASASATAATVTVTETTLSLTITGGANAGTDSFTLANASYDTLSELATGVNALAKGWVAEAVGPSSQASTDLFVKAATSAYGIANALILTAAANYQIERLIDACSAALEKECNRQFLSRSYAEFYRDFCDSDRVLLNQFPIVSVDRVSIGRVAALELKYTSTTAGAAYARVTDTTLVLKSVTTSTTTTTLTLADTDKDTLAELAAYINANATGWTATVRHSNTAYPSADLVPTGAAYCLSPTVATFDVPNAALTEYEFIEATGELIYSYDSFLLGPFGSGAAADKRLYVEYTAGYSTVPYDVQLACAKLVKYAYDSAKKDGTLQGETIGNYSYVRQIIGKTALDEIKELIGPYKRFAL